MTNNFLPNGYEVPSSGGKYFKLQPGSNQFRILDSPILGMEYWNEAGKPVRTKIGENINVGDIRPEKDGTPGRAKHFWAMPVWDGQEVKVLELTQKGIQTDLKDLVSDEDWSDPKEYDIVITRTGEGLETKYTVKPKKAVELSKEAVTAWKEAQKAGFHLAALYDNGDPFNPTTPRSAVEVLSDPMPDYTGQDEVSIEDIEF